VAGVSIVLHLSSFFPLAFVGDWNDLGRGRGKLVVMISGGGCDPVSPPPGMRDGVTCSENGGSLRWRLRGR